MIWRARSLCIASYWLKQQNKTKQKRPPPPPPFCSSSQMKCWHRLFHFLSISLSFSFILWILLIFYCVCFCIWFYDLCLFSMYIRFYFGGCVQNEHKQKPMDFTATTRLLSLICLIFIMPFSTNVIRPMPVSPYQPHILK